ncbi:metabolite traffic protein EboE [Marinimicrobium alkaliphilum]|uniref:metabolite traffic protein EboE n=1 Tax=Marinimicrobium alkaliphilum TaxID=2202654 RepID=UPI000DB93E1A|nr:metabolite traffic protein EboE [Marinimicrobium alkaliphilum]
MASVTTPLTYCSNIHPGESWADVMHNLNSHALDVKKRRGDERPLALGLRIAGQAAGEIDATAIADFRAWCKKHNAYLLTINGFPFGAFHDQRVKENVYLPDWREQQRVDYTQVLADIATHLQPDADAISISTVPIAFKQGFNDEDWPRVFDNLRQVLTHLVNLYDSTGIKITLAIEPEPGCVLETTDEVIDFFTRLRAQLTDDQNAHVGLCFDCCHQAVEFEQPAECLARLAEANIPIAKVQVSSALRATTPEEIEHLLDFDEPVYLHQAVARTDTSTPLARFDDLPDFAEYLRTGHAVSECRVHFHVPIFIEHLGPCGTTQDFLRDFLPRLDPDIPLEVETYSFGVLPAELRTDSVGASIARELEWVENLLESR